MGKKAAKLALVSEGLGVGEGVCEALFALSDLLDGGGEDDFPLVHKLVTEALEPVREKWRHEKIRKDLISLIVLEVVRDAEIDEISTWLDHEATIREIVFDEDGLSMAVDRNRLAEKLKQHRVSYGKKRDEKKRA